MGSIEVITSVQLRRRRAPEEKRAPNEGLTQARFFTLNCFAYPIASS